MKIESIQVDNIKCHGCAASIRRGVSQISGVAEVGVDVDTGTVEIKHDGQINREGLTQHLHSLGYPIQGEGSILTTAKSFISCAIGRMSDKD